ncbi:extracellular solute-binding protein [Cellulomonas sp. P24]|uniref:extracellular solute-binding protein n=1 Tax=Cellulomonas sp. P24 TaxID=2885206 RepID=UPI00216AB342|nr:extracellular solute-binding protein [Cellulomonas sp. P24]MCR6492918.1 extracellular solute-binding protein [Cellulomonas sp. P24]
MKRSLTALAVTAVLTTATLALSGCSGSTSGATGATAGTAAPVTLTMWGTYGNGGNTAQTDVLTKTLIPAFEASHPGITVTYVDIPYDSLKQKLTTGAAGGELPDLVRSDIGWVAQFAQLGVLAPLDEKMKDFTTLSAATYPGSLATNAWNGHYYGLPLDTNTRVLVTSQAALDAAGMSKPPATFDELKAMATALKGKNIAVFADSGLQGWNILPWIWSGGGEITDAKQTTATGYLDGPKSVAAVQMLVDLYKQGAIPNLITGNSGATSTSDGLPKGEYATILDGPWMRDIWKGQYPDFTPIYAPVPAGAGGSVSVVGGEDIVIPATTTHLDAATEFVRFTQSDEFQLAMAKVGQMPVVASAGTKAATADPFYAPFATQLATAKPRLVIPQSSQVDTILSTELTPAFEGTTTVQAALTSAAKQIDALLTSK